MKLYAIKKGRKNNVIVNSWEECQDLTKGFQGMEFKSFSDMRDAQLYLGEGFKSDKEYRAKVITNYYIASNALLEIGTTDNIPRELMELSIKASMATTKIIDFINEHKE